MWGGTSLGGRGGGSCAVSREKVHCHATRSHGDHISDWRRHSVSIRRWVTSRSHLRVVYAGEEGGQGNCLASPVSHFQLVEVFTSQLGPNPWWHLGCWDLSLALWCFVWVPKWRVYEVQEEH